MKSTLYEVSGKMDARTSHPPSLKAVLSLFYIMFPHALPCFWNIIKIAAVNVLERVFCFLQTCNYVGLYIGVIC